MKKRFAHVPRSTLSRSCMKSRTGLASAVENQIYQVTFHDVLFDRYTPAGTPGQPMASNGNVVEESSHYLQASRVLRRGAALTIAAAVVAVLAVRELAVRVLHPDPAFTPLSLGSLVVGTIGCTMMAIYVFVGMMSYSNPVRTWRRVSAVVLILSFLPCVFLAISHIMGGGWPEACALMTMHVVVWATCATLLPSLAITKHRPKTQNPDRPLSIL